MTIPLVVTSQDLAQCLGVADSTFRCFARISRPIDLPFERVPGVHKKPVRMFHLTPVIRWIKTAAPHAANTEFEAALYAKAVSNQERFQ